MEDTDLNWRKASYSNGGASNCVEVANARRAVAVRDTKEAPRSGRTVLRFTPEAWDRFTASVRLKTRAR